jgi:hypothetical protein
MLGIIQKLKVALAALFTIASLLAPLAISGVVSADGPCPGSTAPFPVDCSKLPAGCPGSSLMSEPSNQVTLKCLYSPTATSWTCSAKECVFADTNVTVYKAQSYGDATSYGGNCMSVSKCDLMSKYVYPLINFLIALIGIGVVISIIIGGIQYGSSAGDPQKVTAAKSRIRNAIIALIAFVFLYAMLNFLVPGGLF